MKLRTGAGMGSWLFIQHGPTPSPADTLIGVVDTQELARLIVAAVELAEASSAFTFAAPSARSNMTNPVWRRLATATDVYRAARERVSE